MVPNRATHHKCENCLTISIPQNEKECSSDNFLMMGLQERKTYKFCLRVLRQFCWIDEMKKRRFTKYSKVKSTWTQNTLKTIGRAFIFELQATQAVKDIFLILQPFTRVDVRCVPNSCNQIFYIYFSAYSPKQHRGSFLSPFWFKSTYSILSNQHTCSIN